MKPPDFVERLLREHCGDSGADENALAFLRSVLREAPLRPEPEQEDLISWAEADEEERDMSDGWRCPGCGRCYSPTMMMCSYCVPQAYIAPTIGTLLPTWIQCPNCARYYPRDGHCQKCSGEVTG